MATQHNKPFKLSGVTLYWASVATPNRMSDKYQVDLCQLSERYIEALEARGLTINNKGDERGFYITAKSKYPITVVATEGNLITGNVVGNESVGDVVCVTYPFTVGKGTGIGINKLKVTSLNEFSDEMDVDDVEEL